MRRLWAAISGLAVAVLLYLPAAAQDNPAMNRELIGRLAKLVVVSPLLIIGLVCHLLTLGVFFSIISQCRSTGSYKRTSGLPLLGPLFVAFAYMVNRDVLLLYAAGVLLALEILSGIAVSIVVRKTDATP